MKTHRPNTVRTESARLIWQTCRALLGRASVALLPMLVSLTSYSVSAQNIQYTGRLADQTRRSNFRVNPVTLGLDIEIPLGGYPGRAGASLPITIRYSSKVWRMRYLQSGDGEGGNTYSTWVAPTWGEHTAGGWTSSLAVPLVENVNEFYDVDGVAMEARTCFGQFGGCHIVRRVQVYMPDGSSHELRHPNAVALWPQGRPAPSLAGTYYAVNGSGISFNYESSTLHLPDGSNFRIGGTTSTTTYTDRNGNKLTYDPETKQWTDTLGRPLAAPPIPRSPWPGVSGSPTPGDYPYTIPGVGGKSMTYTFRWKALADALTVAGQELPVTGDCSGIVLDPPPPAAPGLFQSWLNDMVCAETPWGLFNPSVLAEITLPDKTSYQFSYNIYGEIDKVVYPTGGYERFRYETIQAVDWVRGVYEQSNRGVVEHKISVGGTGADEVTWNYSAGYAGPNYAQPYKVTITAPAPDNTRTERLVHTAGTNQYRWGFNDVRIGRVYDEKVFSGSNQMLRRALTQWEGSPQNAQAHGRDPRMTRGVDIPLDTAGDALTKTTSYEYDADLNVTSTTESAYLLIDQATAQVGAITSIPAGAALRTKETTFLVNDPAVGPDTRSAYRSRNLIRLQSSARVLDAAREVVAQTETRYDEPEFRLITYDGPVRGWADPATGVRGNPTTERHWLNTAGTWLETHAQYDQCGSIKSVWDARDAGLQNPAVTDYSPEYHFAYPTTVTSSVPDPDDTGHGHTSGLARRTAYDFDTGRVISVTDASGRETTFEYLDALSRLTKERTPGGGWTSYEYERMSSAGVVSDYVRVRTALDAVRSTDSYQFFDGLGRPSRSYIFDGSAPDRQWIATKTIYDSMRRVWKTSGPIFTATLEDFTPAADTLTRTEYDSLGRIAKVTMPDGGVITTSHDGNEVTVTDQAGKTRRSVSDALGRLEKVVEAPGVPGYGYETTYEYDVLGNLRRVTQGKAGQVQQTRLFEYDSLSRLTSATHPEGGGVTYEYDPAGNLTKKVDARHVQTDYTYDALNRIVRRNYSVEPGHQPPAGFAATPGVSYFYDGKGMPAGGGTPPAPPAAATLGKLTAVKTAAAEIYYTEFNIMGLVEGHLQVVEPNTENERAYRMGYEYDLTGNLRAQTSPSGRVVETEYDGAGRVAGVKNRADGRYYAGSAATDLNNRVKYAPHGAVSEMKLGNGLWEHTRFNSRLQPVEIGLGVTPADSGKLQLTYGYGAAGKNNGNIRSQRVRFEGGPDLTQTYEYDDVNRLSAAREAPTAGGPDAWRQAYTYLDEAGGNGQFGNRRIDAGTDQSTRQPRTTVNVMPLNNPTINPSNNRFDDNQGYGYDAAGNLTKDPSFSYAYDAENRLATVDGGWGGATGASYYYDGDGRRVKKVTASEATVFVYDAQGRVVAEYSNRVEGVGTRYLTQDQLGSTRVVTDARGNALTGGGSAGSRHDYLPFGVELGAGIGGRATEQGYAGATVRQKFTGKERDRETGLDFFAARYYSSSLGRFTSVDPSNVSIEPADPQTWNRYAYAKNSPLRYVDNNGKWPTETHHQFISDAFYGLTRIEIQAIQYGSNLVDTLTGTGEWHDVPITMLPHEAPKHAMTPEGMSQEEAFRQGMRFAHDMMRQANIIQNMRGAKENVTLLPYVLDDKATMSLPALTIFGKGAHMYMDSTSPSHRGWQVYSIPTTKVSVFGVEVTIVDVRKFTEEMLEHKKQESHNPTREERELTLTLLRAYYLTTFGDKAFQRAVPDSAQRQAAYDLLKQQGLGYRP